MSRQRLTMGICPICNRSNGQFITTDDASVDYFLHTRSTVPCKACVKKHLSQGVLLVTSGSYRAMVITNDAFQRVFVSKIPASKVVIISEGEMDELISMLRDDLVSKVVESARS